MAVTDWRIDRSSKADGLGAKTRLRGPYRVLRAIFSDEGDTDEDDGGSITTGWFMKKKGTTSLAFVHDKQDEANRKFNLENFRARPQYDWYVAAKDEATLKDFCGWVSKEIIRRVEAEPQPKRLTASAKEKVNDAIAKGMSVQDAMKKHAEWELIAPAAEAFRWPMKDTPMKEPVPAPPKVKEPKDAPKDAAKGAPKDDEDEDAEDDAPEEPPAKDA